MPTYYIQISSAWKGDRWHTPFKTGNKGEAEYIADGLAIGENQFGERNPGGTGVRYARVISKTRLQREAGVAAVRMAKEDADLGHWDDPPTRRIPEHQNPPKGMEMVDTETAVYIHHEPSRVADDVRELIKAYQEEQAKKAKAGYVDFLVRGIPANLHEQTKRHANEQCVPMNGVFIEAVKMFLTFVKQNQ